MSPPLQSVELRLLASASNIDINHLILLFRFSAMISIKDGLPANTACTAVPILVSTTSTDVKTAVAGVSANAASYCKDLQGLIKS